MQKENRVEGYCDCCKRTTKWVKHADLPYYVCGSQGCFGKSKDPRKNKQPEVKPNYYKFGGYKILVD